MDKPPISISLVMPAYNEEASVESAVRHNQKTLESINLDYEIVIVNDKSTDHTGEIIEKVAKQFPHVRCYHHEKNLGSGGAFRTGIEHATKDYVMFVPFDNPLDREDMEAYLLRMGVCDIVVGVRVERVGYSRMGLICSFIYNRILIPLFFNIGIADANWIQAYRRSIFTEGIVTFSNSRIFFLVEILINARRKRLIIAEIPSKMKRRLHGIPTCTRFSTMWKTFWDMISFFIAIRKEDSVKKKMVSTL